MSSNYIIKNDPTIDHKRSTFKYPLRYTTTLNVGKVVPLGWHEILPGDTLSIKTVSVFCRTTTMLKPVMGTAILDVYMFYVPNRIIWEHWVNLMGQNDNSAWAEATEYHVPQIKIPTGGFDSGTLMDYLDCPVKTGGGSTVSHLPVRAYCQICNDFFRSQDVQDPVFFNKGDSDTDGSNTATNYVTDIVTGGALFDACKLHDFFTDCLPSPQKGNPVEISLIDTSVAITGTESIREAQDSLLTSDGKLGSFVGTSNKDGSITFQTPDGSTQTSFNTLLPNPREFASYLTATASANAIPINDLRFAVQLQRQLEKDARYGTRYVEFLLANFGVQASDRSLQRAEMLWGKSFPLNVQQVTNTNGTSDTVPLGEYGANSTTIQQFDDTPTKSFEEHGILMPIVVARYKHSYSQGLQKKWVRKERFDFYIPTFAHIGEQPVYVSELFLTAENNPTTNATPTIFGYQEAWRELRESTPRVTGLLRPELKNGLETYTYGDVYESEPTLSPDWLKEDNANFERTLVYKTETAPNLILDFYADCDLTRAMPVESIPGYIDHF